MPNDLTGDFDVVAEFAIPAVNRVLATMHRSERFLHSLTISFAIDEFGGVDTTAPLDVDGGQSTGTSLTPSGL